MNCGQIGLILDILGVLLLFVCATKGAFTASLLDILTEATSLTSDKNIPKRQGFNKAKIYSCLSYLGISLVVVGFGLQFAQTLPCVCK